MNDEMISTLQAAELLDIHRSSVVRLLQKGTLEGKQIGKVWVVYKSSIEEYIKKFGDLPKHSSKKRQK